MAEIKIRKKRPVWPWILLILIIIAVVVYFVFFTDENYNDNKNYNSTTTNEQVDNGAFSAGENEENRNASAYPDSSFANRDSLTYYSTIFAGDIKSGPNVEIEPKNVNRALINLIDAVRAKALQKNVELSANLKQEREDALKRTETAQDSTAASNFVKNTGNSIVAALQNIQKEKYPQLSQSVNDLQNSLNNIDASKSINNQNHRINTFFDKSVNVLSAMN